MIKYVSLPAVPSILWLTADLLFDHRHQGAVVQKKNKSM